MEGDQPCRAVQAPCKPPTRQQRFMPHASRSSRPSAPSIFPHMPSMPPLTLMSFEKFHEVVARQACPQPPGRSGATSGSTEHAKTTQYRDPCRSKWARSSKKAWGCIKRPRTTIFRLFLRRLELPPACYTPDTTTTSLDRGFAQFLSVLHLQTQPQTRHVAGVLVVALLPMGFGNFMK